MKTSSVEGSGGSDIMVYTLSTCVWCKKVKQFLDDLGVGYRYVDVDGLAGQDREEALEEMKRWNPGCSFPSVVINQATCIVGFDAEKIKAALTQ